jgi:hypothetical protein
VNLALVRGSPAELICFLHRGSPGDATNIRELGATLGRVDHEIVPICSCCHGDVLVLLIERHKLINLGPLWIQLPIQGSSAIPHRFEPAILFEYSQEELAYRRECGRAWHKAEPGFEMFHGHEKIKLLWVRLDACLSFSYKLL